MADIKLTVSSNFNEASGQLAKFGKLTESETRRIDNALKKIKGDQIDSFIQSNQRAGIAITATRGKMDGLKSQSTQLQRKMEMLIRNGMDPQDQALQKLQKEYVSTATAVKKLEQAQEAQTKAMEASKTTALALGTALLAVSAYGTKAQADYAKEIANVNTLIDISQDEFKSLDSTIEKMSNTFAIQKKELGAGTYQAVSAGARTLGEALDIVENSAKLGKSALVENTQAVDIITTAMNAYGRETISASKASDIYFQIIKKGKINGEQLAATIGQSIPLYAGVGISLKEMGAGLASMTKMGVKSSEATTQLNAIVNAFLKPSEAMTLALEASEYASGSALLEAEGLSGAIAFLTKNTGGSKEEMAKLLPNIRALRGAMALGAQEGEVFAEVLKDFEDVTGATDEALKRQTEGFAKNVFTTEQAIVAMQNLVMTIGEKVLPVLGRMSQFVVTLVTDFDSLSTPMKVMVKLLPLLGAGVGAFMLAMTGGSIIAGFSSAIALLSSSWAVLNATMLASPIGWVVAGIAGIAFALNGLTDVIVGNMNARSDAVGTWANADSEAKKKVADNLREIWKLQTFAAGASKEDKERLKELTQQVEKATGAKVQYAQTMEEMALVNGAVTQTVKQLDKAVWASGVNAKKKADQDTLLAEERKKQVEAEQKALQATQEAEMRALLAKKQAEADYAKSQKEAKELILGMERRVALAKIDGFDQELYLIEEKYTKEKALIENYEGDKTEALRLLAEERALLIAEVEDKAREDKKKKEAEASKQEKELALKTFQDKMNLVQTSLQMYASMGNGVSRLLGVVMGMGKKAGKEMRGLAVAQKLIAIATAGINTALAVTQALAQPPGPPYTLPQAKLAGVLGGIEVAAITATPIPSAETGGHFSFPTSDVHRSDGNLVKVNDGEDLSVTPRGESVDKNLRVKIVLNDRELWEQTQRGIDAGEITFTNANMVGAF